jgi:hypothetical protein
MRMEGQIGGSSISSPCKGLYPGPGVIISTQVLDDGPNLHVVSQEGVMRGSSCIDVRGSRNELQFGRFIVCGRVVSRSYNGHIISCDIGQRDLGFTKALTEIGVESIKCLNDVLFVEFRRFSGGLVRVFMVSDGPHATNRGNSDLRC